MGSAQQLAGWFDPSQMKVKHQPPGRACCAHIGCGCGCVCAGRATPEGAPDARQQDVKAEPSGDVNGDKVRVWGMHAQPTVGLCLYVQWWRQQVRWMSCVCVRAMVEAVGEADVM